MPPKKRYDFKKAERARAARAKAIRETEIAWEKRLDAYKAAIAEARRMRDVVSEQGLEAFEDDSSESAQDEDVAIAREVDEDSETEVLPTPLPSLSSKHPYTHSAKLVESQTRGSVSGHGAGNGAAPASALAAAHPRLPVAPLHSQSPDPILKPSDTAAPVERLPGGKTFEILLRSVRASKAKRSAPAAPLPTTKRQKVTVNLTDRASDSDSEGTSKPSGVGPELENNDDCNRKERDSVRGKKRKSQDNTSRQRLKGPQEVKDDKGGVEEPDMSDPKDHDELGGALGLDDDPPELPSESDMTNTQKRAEVKRLFSLIVDILLPV